MSDPTPPTPPQPPIGYPSNYGSATVYNTIWEVATLSWIKQTAAAGAAGPVSIADGADVAEGATTDAAWVSGAGTVIGILKKIAAGASTNVTQWNGTTVATNSGVKGAGTLQVVLATDQPALTNKLLVTPDSVALPANQSVNVNQFGGAAVTIGQQVAGSSLPVILPAATVTTLTPPAAITGFALEAGHLATIDTSTAKIPAQGQALAAASMPVVLTAIQQTALTPPAAITGFALEATQLTGNTTLASLLTFALTQQAETLEAIRVELRVITAFLGSGLNVQDDPALYRNDPTFLN